MNGRNWTTHMMRISELNTALRRQSVELLYIIISRTLYTHEDQNKTRGILGTAMLFVSKPKQIFMSRAAKGFHCSVDAHNVRTYTQLDHTCCFSIDVLNAIMSHTWRTTKNLPGQKWVKNKFPCIL